jgi:hypothetical protein
LDSNGVKQPSGQINSGKIYLNPSDFNQTIDQGFYNSSGEVCDPWRALADYVWVDSNANGLQDSDEFGVKDVTVVLIGGGVDGKINGIGDDDTSISTFTTGVNGYYEFTDLAPGVEYQVQFIKPTGSVFTTTDVGSNDDIDSDANVVDGKTQIVTLAPGVFNPTLDAGILTASLGDRLWVDSNGNGKQDTGETGISGKTITLISGGADGLINGIGDNLTAATTTTGPDGIYHFIGLTPGVEYQVQFSKPTGYTYTGQDLGGDDAKDSDVNASGLSQIVTLASGENNLTIDAGVYQTASLGDRVWLDCNGNGKQDDGEVGVAKVAVKLIGGGADGVINGIGDTTATTTTNASGNYEFTGLTPGVQYQVQFTPLSGYSFTTANAGSDDALDSDAQPSGVDMGKTQVVTLSSGENNPTLDAGLTPVCRPVTFDFSGSSATDGCDGNTRTYTDALTGVSVTARAFSQDQGYQQLAGAPSSAPMAVVLASPTPARARVATHHTVDNIGRNNYIVLQFSQSGAGRQGLPWLRRQRQRHAQIWIGNSANPITSMNNSVLNGALSFSGSGHHHSRAPLARWTSTPVACAATCSSLPLIPPTLRPRITSSSRQGDRYARRTTVDRRWRRPALATSCGKTRTTTACRMAGENGISGVTVKLLEQHRYRRFSHDHHQCQRRLRLHQLEPGRLQGEGGDAQRLLRHQAEPRRCNDLKRQRHRQSTGITPAVVSLAAGENDLERRCWSVPQGLGR